MIEWESDDAETLVPAHRDVFANAPKNTTLLDGAEYHAFYNREHRFAPFRRIAVGPVTVVGDDAQLEPGATRITYGSAALLTCDWWFNYSHFLVDGLPKWRAYSDLGIDALLVSPNSAALPLLERAGIDAKIHLLSPEECVGVRRLWLASDTGPPSMKPAWVVDYVRGLLGASKPVDGPQRRLWISRTDTGHRQLQGGAGIEERIKDLGFEVLVASHLPVDDQIALFSSAEHVAGVHGAGFANMLFCDAGSALLELFDPYWLNGAFRIICAHRGVRWRYMTGEDYAGSEPVFRRDVRLDGDTLLEALERFVGEPSNTSGVLNL